MRAIAYIIWGVIGLFFLLVLVVKCSSNSEQSPNSIQSTPEKTAIEKLEQTESANIAPDGELAEIFSIGSNYTDLQRELTLEKIQGKVVSWTLPVYEVSRSGDGYTIQTQGSIGDFQNSTKVVTTFIFLQPRNSDELQLIQTVRTGDMISFKGVIKDVTLRSLEVAPAILIIK